MFTDEFLAFLELKQDLLYHKIPQEKIPYFVREALAAGRQKAKEQSNRDIFALYRQAKIAIQEEDHDGVYFKVEMRAQYESDRKGNHRVFLYLASLNKLASDNGITVKKMKEIILTHEYFHYLEDQEKFDVAEHLASIETMKVLGVSRKAKIRRASEIAANAFTKEFLQLAYLPSYYDYHYLLSNQEITMADLEAEYQEYQQIFQ